MITLTNDFHSTEVRCHPVDGRLSKSQVDRAWRALCGLHDCTCCNSAGQRGRQDVSLDILADGSAIVIDD